MPSRAKCTGCASAAHASAARAPFRALPCASDARLAIGSPRVASVVFRTGSLARLAGRTAFGAGMAALLADPTKQEALRSVGFSHAFSSHVLGFAQGVRAARREGRRQFVAAPAAEPDAEPRMAGRMHERPLGSNPEVVVHVIRMLVIGLGLAVRR